MYDVLIREKMVIATTEPTEREMPISVERP